MEEEEQIVNKEFYEGIKDVINCMICSCIIEDPIQCNKCQNLFCRKCIDDWTNKKKICPLDCTNNKFISAHLCKSLISQIIIQCKCGEKISYVKYKKHQLVCPIYNDNVDINKLYLELKQKYDKLVEEKKKEEEEYTSFKNEAYILLPTHKHKLKIIRRFINNLWFCNGCGNKYNFNIPSYHCTLCDYDICYHCSIKLKPLKGQVLEELAKFY